MFTGLVQALGTLQLRSPYEVQITYHSDGRAIAADLAYGDSIAVDGVCLSVTDILEHGFVAAVSPETLRRTTLEHTSGQNLVNLEASLKVGSKVGGHFVTGHVDGLGHLVSSQQTATSWDMTFRVAHPTVARYIVPKGSIAINGVSLTVADCTESGDQFSVAVIPLTYADTNLSRLAVGDRVNLEGDVLGKYVEKFLRVGTTSGMTDEIPDALTPDFLAEHGYL